MPPFDETQDARPRSRQDNVSAWPTLVLARGAGVPGARRRVPSEGLVLGREVPLFGGELPGDPRVSRRHASMTCRAGAWWISDLRSRNGTWVNGQRLGAAVRLHKGDVIRVGDTVMVFSLITPSRGRAEVGFPGCSDTIRDVRMALGAVALHPHTVLLLGETGAGKEIAARTLHQLSGRTGEFVAVNCAALSEGVLESELFGHERGAFTGASGARAGLFRAAAGGTLFLDEIGEMPLNLQSKLLRVLESRAIRPVGGERELPVDVRVLAATNQDLVARIRDEAFRRDLYARLAQWVITLPPLRSRREDIPSLIEALKPRLKVQDRPLSADLAEALLIHPWPLNTRGLLNALSATIISSNADTLELTAEVEATLRAARKLVAAPSTTLQGNVEAIPSPEELSAALRASRGRVAAAARQLGCSRQQIYRLLQSYGLQVDDFRDGA